MRRGSGARRRVGIAAALVLAATSACTAGTAAVPPPGGGPTVPATAGLPSGSPPSGGAPSASPPSPAPSPAPSSASPPAAPDPDRPVVDVALDVAADLRSATGRERIAFTTPDRRVCELVFRAWPNKPATADAGNALVVTAADVDGRAVVPRTAAAGAPPGRPGTLVELPVRPCAAPRATLTAELDFLLVLGGGTDERVGTSARDEVAWLGGAIPLLAWESGRGWAREPAVDVAGEMATSEDFRLRSLDVTAPAGLRVLGTGTPTGTRPGSADGTTVHGFTAPAVRDIAVTLGRLDVLERDVRGVAVRIGASARRDAPLEEWAAEVERALRGLTTWLGPYPYDDLWVSVLADQSSGVELPTHVQLGAGDPGRRGWIVSHELAHQWFYALVGNDQARDPWLDESFAVLAQRVVDGDLERRTGERSGPGDVGDSMSEWAAQPRPTSAYVDRVYTDGGAALLRARQRAGAEAFDTALRVYVRENAHTIATPDDVTRTFAGLPTVLEELRAVGALDGRGARPATAASLSRPPAPGCLATGCPAAESRPS